MKSELPTELGPNASGLTTAGTSGRFSWPPRPESPPPGPALGPGGATALIYVIGSPKIHHLGYLYVLMPVGVGVALMLLVALLFNNLSPRRRYPEFWW